MAAIFEKYFYPHAMSNHNLLLETASLNNQELNVDLLSVKKASLVLRALNHKLRQIILKLIAENDGITVSEIYSKLLLEQSVASQHLAILRKAGFVKTKRDGKFIYYSINKQRFLELNEFIKALLHL